MAKLMKNNPESRQKEATNKGPESDISKTVKKTLGVPTPEAEPVGGYDLIKAVNRERASDSPEEARQKNNRTRDQRSNLGRSYPGNITTS